MIYGYMLESKNDNIEQLFTKEFNTFSSIVESINILTENHIILNEFDFKSILDKISKAWNNFKIWFNEHVVEFFKKVINKIKESFIGKKIEDIKTKLKSKKSVKDIKLNPKNSDDSSTNEAYLLEEDNSITEIKTKVEMSLKPDLFFRLDNYVDMNRIESIYKEFNLSIKRCVDFTTSINVNDQKEMSNAVNSNPELSNIASNLDKFKDTISTAYKGSLLNAKEEDVESLIRQDVAKRASSTIGVNELLDLITDNMYENNKSMSRLNSIINELKKTEQYIDSIINSGKVTNYTLGVLNRCITIVRNTSKRTSLFIQNIAKMFSTSSKTLYALGEFANKVA